VSHFFFFAGALFWGPETILFFAWFCLVFFVSSVFFLSFNRDNRLLRPREDFFLLPSSFFSKKG